MFTSNIDQKAISPDSGFANLLQAMGTDLGDFDYLGALAQVRFRAVSHLR